MYATLYFRFLAEGSSYGSLARRFRIHPSTVHKVVKRTVKAIWTRLQPLVKPVPDRAKWEEVERGFRTRWNFPNCCGAVDGKHVVMTCPYNSGTLFYNYKGTYSINLMALVDWNYRFLCVDVGAYGSNSDSPVFAHSSFGRRFLFNDFDMPPAKEIPGAPELGPLPHVIVGDAAFPLRHNIMRPYPTPRHGRRMEHDKDIFNYRLARARRMVECAFGILAQRFRIFNRPMQQKRRNVVMIVKACCALHNYLRDNKKIPQTYAELNPDQIPYLTEDGTFLDLENLNGYRSTDEAQVIRNRFCEYFNSPAGAVPFQERRTAEHRH